MLMSPFTRPACGVRSVMFTAMVLALVAGPALFAGPAHADNLKSWDEIIPDGGKRFKVLKAFNDEAVLDKETQLVWERSAAFGTPTTWVEAQSHCATRVVGGRMGWRLPTIEELTSLIDPSAPEVGAKLPPGHPFNVGTTNYWSSTTRAGNPDVAWFVRLALGEAITVLKIADFRTWCVRGRQGHDGY